MGRSEYERSLWWFFFLHSFIQDLIEKYPELYDEPDGDISQHQINFGRKWGDYSSVVQLAGDDLLKLDEVTQQPLEQCLLYLAYLSDKQLTEKLLHKEMLAKYKTK